MATTGQAWGYDRPYYWVVICKNNRLHHKQNQMYGHKIRLAETDAFEAVPGLTP